MDMTAPRSQYPNQQNRQGLSTAGRLGRRSRRIRSRIIKFLIDLPPQMRHDGIPCVHSQFKVRVLPSEEGNHPFGKVTARDSFSPWCGRRFGQCASWLAGVSRARIFRVSGNGISTADAATMHPRTRASYGGCHRSVTISPRVSPTAMPRATSKSCLLRMKSEVPLLRISITAPVEISETMKFVRYWCMGGVGWGGAPLGRG